MHLAEIDPIQIAIIVIAMLGGFVQWVWGLVKQGMEETKRAAAQPTADEKALREAAWKKQVQAAPVPAPAADPWSAAREIFTQIQKEATGQPAYKPAQPAAQTQTRPPPLRATKAAAYVPPPQLPLPSLHVVVKPVILEEVATTAAVKMAAARQDRLELLKGLLTNPNAIRQAVLMREILGPPKALQSSADSAF